MAERRTPERLIDLPRVLVIPSWYPSGIDAVAGTFIREQVLALAGAGVPVSVLVPTTEFDAGEIQVENDSGVPTVRVGVGPLPSGRGVTALARRMLAQLSAYPRAGVAGYEAIAKLVGPPDIVHVQSLFPAGLAARAIRNRFGTPYVVTEHSEEYLEQSNRRLTRAPLMIPVVLRPLAKAARRTIAVSGLLADRLVELDLAVDPVVVPNVVPLRPALPHATGEPKRIAHISVMGPAKNLPRLIRAVNALSYRRTDFVLSAVGDGEAAQQARELTIALKQSKRVVFPGRIPPSEVESVLAESAFTVISSDFETFSVSAAEALMSGRPVVSTRCGGPESFITDEVGILVDRDHDALADGMDEMLDRYLEFDPEALHAYAAKRFAPAVIAERLIGIYREALRAG